MKVGDKVRSLVTIEGYRTEGKVYEITDVDSIGGSILYWYYDDDNCRIHTRDPETFELIKEEKEMKNTKEIDVWINDEDLQNYLSGRNLYDLNIFVEEELDGDKEGFSKAKLIVNIPEKKVEITLNTFNNAWQKVNGSTWKNSQEADYYRALIKELGLK